MIVLVLVLSAAVLVIELSSDHRFSSFDYEHEHRLLCGPSTSTIFRTYEFLSE